MMHDFASEAEQCCLIGVHDALGVGLGAWQSE